MWASGAFDFIYGLPLYLIYCIFNYLVNDVWMRLGVDIFNNKCKTTSALFIGLRFWLLHNFDMTAGSQMS